MEEFFTDLADDLEVGAIGMKRFKEQYGRISVTTTHVNGDAQGYRHGHYHAIDDIATSDNVEVTRALSDILLSYIKGIHRLMIVGFGNDRYTLDSLGKKTISHIDIDGCDRVKLMTLLPLVESVTGMDSIDVVRSIATRFKPDSIIAIDTLATSRLLRLGNSMQITDAGMSPGAGVSARQNIISSDNMGVPVIAVGVPLVINTRYLGGGTSGMYLIPSTIDYIVDSCGSIIGNAIMSAAGHAGDK